MFAALEIATGKVTGLCKNRHRHIEFLGFLKQVARIYPDVERHLVLDNYSTHKHAKVKAWLAATPRITVHFTPTSGSWLNLVEVWFGIIERQAIRRGVFSSVRDLMIKIRTFIDEWNRCHPIALARRRFWPVTPAGAIWNRGDSACSGISRPVISPPARRATDTTNACRCAG